MNAHRLRQLGIIALIGMTMCASTAWADEGLVAEIINVNINNDLKPEITFTLKDNSGAPLSLNDVSIRGFILAQLQVLDPQTGSAVYNSYTTTVEEAGEGSPNFPAEATQATYDSGGEYEQLEPGVFKYIFNTAVPSDYDRTATHTASAQMSREIGDDEYVANPIFHYVPDGSEVEILRRVVTNEACNTCHTSLGMHGGGRKDVTLCLTCHSPQTTDPDTGNTVDMTTMIHKIHMGANLPSVEAGGEYKIIGYRQSVHNYSNVHYPQPVVNCQSCHQGENGNLYKTAPSMRACGSCHDNVNFETGENHANGLPVMDNQCKSCHQPEGEAFGLSVAGAHTWPLNAPSLAGLNGEIVEVLDTEPGMAPTVRYRITEDDGTLVDPANLSTATLTYAGPTTSYEGFVRESIADTSILDGDSYLYTFTAPIPADAMGTFAFSMEGRRAVEIDGEEVEESLFNPVFYSSVTGETVLERRDVIAQDNCEACHGEFYFHGNLRRNMDYCVMCHNKKVTDIEERPEGVGGGESVDFAYMIHKIHTGAELNQEYVVYGHGNRPHDFNEIHFPGMEQKCNICHIEEFPDLPLAETIEPIEFTNKEGQLVMIQPTTAACTSCHDMKAVIGHAELNTTQSGIETCYVCHSEGGIAGVPEAHELDIFLNNIVNFGQDGTSVDPWFVHEE